MRSVAALLAIFFAIFFTPAVSAHFPPATISLSPDAVVIANGFLSTRFSLSSPALDTLVADFDGAGNYSSNLLAGDDPRGLGRGGLVLERRNSINQLWTTIAASSAASSIGGAAPPPPPQVAVLVNTSAFVSVRIAPVFDSNDPFATVRSTWTLSLARGARNVSVGVAVEAVRSPPPGEGVVSVGLSAYLRPAAVFARFADGAGLRGGTLSTLHSTAPFFAESAARVRLERVYALDPGTDGGAVDVAVRAVSKNVSSFVVLSGRPPAQWFASGFSVLFAGALPDAETTKGVYHVGGWSDDYRLTKWVAIEEGQRWSVELDIGANSRSFPSGAVPPPQEQEQAPPLPTREELQAFLAGAYANAASELVTHILPGQAASEMLQPLRTAYHDVYTFYDPDCFFAGSALCHSAYPGFIAEAASLVETSQRFSRPTGQIPHHFVAADVATDPTGQLPHVAQNLTVVFDAISGATQTGPNLFWAMTALRVAAASGDYDGLCDAHVGNFGKIGAAIHFITAMIDPKVHLIVSPGGGSLWIDTLRRGNYTTDTNAFAVTALRRYAKAASFCAGRVATTNAQQAAQANAFRAEAAYATSTADAIAAAMNKLLWNGEDHYFTQRNPDGTTRDFVDYDSNLLALAAGVASPQQAAAVLGRIAKGRCAASNPGLGPPGTLFPQYVSEKVYGPADCFLENIGDSVVAMGRIAWADGHARRRAATDALRAGNASYYEAQREVFEDRILAPIVQAIAKNTWLPERYICDPARGVLKSQPAHSQFYGEFGNTAAMLLFEIKYGIDIGFSEIVVDPFLPRPILAPGFSWRVGGVEIAPFSAERACLKISSGPSGVKTITFTGMYPGVAYAVPSAAGVSVHADAYGALRFNATVGGEHEVCVVAKK